MSAACEGRSVRLEEEEEEEGGEGGGKPIAVRARVEMHSCQGEGGVSMWVG